MVITPEQFMEIAIANRDLKLGRCMIRIYIRFNRNFVRI